MIGFIDDHRVVHGVESICRVLPIAPSTYYACLAVRADPSKASARQQRDAVLRPKIQKVWDDNWKVYGVRKAWRQLCREGEAAARCTVARLMASMGLRGIVRGKAMKTTIPDTSVPCPRDIGVFRRKSAFGEPQIPSASTKYAVGQRLHICLNMAGLRLRRLRDRHLRQPHCRLEGVAVCKDRLRSRCT